MKKNEHERPDCSSWIVKYDEFIDILEFYSKDYYLLDESQIMRNEIKDKEAVIVSLKKAQMPMYVRIDNAYDHLGIDANDVTNTMLTQMVFSYLH